MKEARFYTREEDLSVTCYLCNHRCHIKQEKKGVCSVRQNMNGILYTLVYGNPIAQHVDPIEKKPLFHYFPGSLSFSIATVGCNFRCLHCQNSDISQAPRESSILSHQIFPPEKIVEAAKKNRCRSISYTYTEPTIYCEYAFDCAVLAKGEGIGNVFVTNGYITPEALKEIKPYLDAANIDLKSFRDDFYRRVCGARLEPTLDSIRAYKEFGIWIELTTLIIPNHNDTEEELRDIARFIKELGVDTPWHVTAFYPTYKITDQHRTPAGILRKAREIGLNEGLRYVYTGNVPGDDGENTYCYQCGKLLVERIGFSVKKNNIRNAKCSDCSAKIDGIWE
jgi:pyruvate formate lyase activating enzyme